ncbi:MAG TPA: Ig-like domain-containing protein [Desulfomonilia bacterium]
MIRGAEPVRFFLAVIILLALGLSGCIKVVSTDPAKNSSDVSRIQVITVVFNSSPKASTVNGSTFFVKDAGGNPVEGNITCSGTQATFMPKHILATHTTYSVTLTSGIKDGTGLPMLSRYSFQFTTNDTSEKQVTDAWGDQFDASISGNLVVYTDFSGVDADIWYADLTTGLSYPVTTASGDQQLSGVYGGRIAYSDWNTMDVLVYDVASHTTLNITNAAVSNSFDPALGGNLIAWTDDRDGNAEIYARDLSTSEERRITSNILTDQAAAVGDGIIVWERCDGYACDVFAYEWATGVTTQLTATPWASERFPDVSGRTVVFHREQGTPIEKNIVAFDLDTLTEKVLSLTGDQENAHISGDFVVFNDSATGLSHIGLWQLSTGGVFEITSGGDNSQYLPDIDGNRITYTDNRSSSGELNIYMCTF